MGWLIQSEGKKQEDLSSWMRTWEFAKDLHTRYGAGAKHLLLGPPRRFAIGNSDAALLNAHLWHLAQHKNVSARYAEGNVLVQPINSCPSSSCVLLGCYRNKLESFRMDIGWNWPFSRASALQGEIYACTGAERQVSEHDGAEN
mgnify:CR=1 FL=1